MHGWTYCSYINKNFHDINYINIIIAQIKKKSDYIIGRFEYYQNYYNFYLIIYIYILLCGFFYQL